MNHFDLDGKKALLSIADPAECIPGQIDDPAVDKGTAIVDSDNHAPIVPDIGNLYPGAEWQGSVCGRQGKLIEPLPARGLSKQELHRIKRREALLGMTDKPGIRPILNG